MDEPDIAEPIPAFIRGKYLFSQQCLWPILDVALASKNRTTYAAVLGVDRRVRDWIIPPEMQVSIQDRIMEVGQESKINMATASTDKP
jgi:hypothetical protein